MSTEPLPAPVPSPTPSSVAGPGPYDHLTIGNRADTERFKAEFAAKMKESAKHWPKRKAKKKRV